MAEHELKVVNGEPMANNAGGPKTKPQIRLVKGGEVKPEPKKKRLTIWDDPL